jgi:KUP system potassium uptake protein
MFIHNYLKASFDWTDLAQEWRNHKFSYNEDSELSAKSKHAIWAKKQTETIDDIYRIDFYLGFREPTKINLMFKEVIKDMVNNGEVDITSRYESLNKNNILGDFKFVLSEKFLSNDSDVTFFEKIVMNAYFIMKKFSLSEEKGFGLDSSSVKVEQFPLVLHAPEKIHLDRIK